MAALFEGKLTGHIGRIIFGWAWCPLEPLRRVYVEILLDGASVGCVSAQLYNADLNTENKGTGYYAFAYQLPDYALKNTQRIQAKFANQETYLEGVISVIEDNDAQKKFLPIDAALYDDGGLSLQGWLRDPFDALRVYTINCFYKGNKIASVQTRQIKQEKGAFKIELPIFLADGLPHEIEVKSENNLRLPGSPLKILAHPQGVLGILESLYCAHKNNDQQNVEKDFQLAKVALKNYGQRLSKSLRLIDYDSWFLRYESTFEKNISSKGFILIGVLASDGNVARTLESLIEQTHSNWLAWVEGDIPVEFQPHSQIQSRPIAVNLDAFFDAPLNLLTYIKAGDYLSTEALRQVITVFEEDNNVGVVYTDCDEENGEKKKTNPWFKPAWDYDLFLSLNYIDHLCVVNMGTIKKIPNDLRQLPWLAVEKALTNNKSIKHLPRVLYHRQMYRKISNGEAILHLQWCRNFLKKQEASSTVIANPKASFLRKITRTIPQKQPLISLIIPTKDQPELLRACIESIEKKSTYQSYELIIVDNQTTDKTALELLAALKKRGHKVIQYNYKFNYSAINNFAVNFAKGEIIGLINNDIEVITPYWMEEMLSLLLRPNIGAVGAKLLWPNDMVQHGGVVLGMNNLAGHIGNENMRNHFGYQGLLQVTHQVSAVTAACLLTRKADYLSVKGLDELSFPVAFNDVDYCLKLAKANLACVWTPFARMIHAESISRGKDDSAEKMARAQMEMTNLRRQWLGELMRDRYYHPSLSLSSLDAPFSALAMPPRNRGVR